MAVKNVSSVATVSGATAVLSPSGGDDGAQITAALSNYAPMNAPNVVLTSQSFNLVTGAVMPKGSATLRGTPGGGTILTCSATAQKAIDVVATNPGDTIGPHYIMDITVDHNNAGGANGAFYNCRRADFNHAGLYLYRNSTRNVSLTAGNVMVTCSAPTAQRNLLHFVAEDNVWSGGLFGMIWQGQGGTFGPGVNVFCDKIWWVRNEHDTLNLKTGGGAESSANGQIGSTGYCGNNIYIAWFWGRNSHDVMLEVDAHANAVLEHIYAENPWNAAVLHTKFREVGTDDQGNTLNPDQNKLTVRDLVVTQTVNLNNSTPKLQIVENATAAVPINSVLVDGYTYKRSAPGGVQNLGPGTCFAVGGVGNNATVVGDITFRNIKSLVEGFTGDNAGAATWVMGGFYLATAPAGAIPAVLIEDLVSMIHGTQGVGALSLRHLQFEGSMILTRGKTTFDHQVTGQTGNTSLAVYGATAATLGPGTRIEDAAVRNGFVGNATPRGEDIQGTATLTITDEVLIENSDWSNLAGGSGAEVRFNAAQNRNKVRLCANKYVAVNGTTYRGPAAQSTNNFTTATFVSGTWNQYLGGDDATLVFANGAGTLTTAIDVSIDGGTTSENAWTQASGALAQTVRISVRNGMWIRVTSTGVPPTCTVEPIA